MKSVRIEEVNFRWCEWISDQLVVATGLPELQDPGNKPGSQLADKECQDALPACKDETDNDCNDEQNAVACDIAEQRREGHKSREYIETENVDQNAEQLNTAHSKANVQGGKAHDKCDNSSNEGKRAGQAFDPLGGLENAERTDLGIEPGHQPECIWHCYPDFQTP